MELKDLRAFKALKEKDTLLAGQVESVYRLTYETINGISRYYDNYTMHDMNHGLRVAAYMEELAFGLGTDFDTNINSFNALELALIILSAILHDIGMVIRPEDEEEIKKNNIKYTDSLTFDGVLKVSKNEKEAIKEIVRITHAARISEFVDYKIGGTSINEILLVNGNYSFAEDIVTICRAHGEDYSYLKQIRTKITKGSYTYNPQYIAVLLRIADYLDLDKQRTPILWYSVMGIEGFSREEWEKHFIIQNEKKLRSYIDGKLQIYFDGNSANANIHRKYLRYIDEIRTELECADALLNTVSADKKYALKVSTKVEDCVQTKGFKYSDLRLVLDYSAITNLLMGKNIYGNSRLGLRELIQNAIDACEVMREIRKDNHNIPEPEICISYSKEKRFVKIKDNGIGMSLDVVRKHFLNVGKSYYKSNEYMHMNFEYKPIGQFGIGFLACFLLSDNVTVKTKYYKNNEINQIELEKNSEYVVTNTEQLSYFYGTEKKLDYEKFFSVFGSEEELYSFIEKYFHTSIPIFIHNEDTESSPRRINNFCERIIDNMIKDTSKGKFEEIDCQRYSDVIQGKIIVKTVTREKSEKVLSIIKDKMFIFDSHEKVFRLISQGALLQDGCYILIKYADLTDNEYSIFSKTRKTDTRKRKEILERAREKEEDIILLINAEDNIDSMPLFVDCKPIRINEVDLDVILLESGLPYYPELVSDINYFEEIFISEDKYVYLQDCEFCYFSRPYGYISDVENREFFLYNKGILVDQFTGIVCSIPYSLEGMGYINYSGDHIKLDVSRNTIISGHKILSWELSLILLRYILEKKNLNDESMKIFRRMIEFLSKMVREPYN